MDCELHLPNKVGEVVTFDVRGVALNYCHDKHRANRFLHVARTSPDLRLLLTGRYRPTR